LAEARANLAKLIEERKESAAELVILGERLDALCERESGGAAAKQRRVDMDSTYVASTCDEEEDGEAKKRRGELERQIERTKEEIEMKNVQINELQSMVIEGDADEKAKHLFNSIHGLLEAKVVLKHLYSTGVQYLLDSRIKQESYEQASNGRIVFGYFFCYLILAFFNCLMFGVVAKFVFGVFCSCILCDKYINRYHWYITFIMNGRSYG